MAKRIESFKCCNCGKMNYIKIKDEEYYSQRYPLYNAANLDFDQIGDLYMKCKKCSYAHINIEEYFYFLDDILSSKSYKKPYNGRCKEDVMATDFIRIALLLKRANAHLEAAKFLEYAVNRLNQLNPSNYQTLINEIHVDAISELQAYLKNRIVREPEVILMYINVLRLVGWGDSAREIIYLYKHVLYGLDQKILQTLENMIKKGNRKNLSFYEMMTEDLI